MKKEIKELVVLGSVIVAVFLISVLAMTSQNGDYQKKGLSSSETKKMTEEEIAKLANEIIIEQPFEVKSFTGMLIGFDKSEGLTDVIMVAYFDAVVNEVKIISVPRDLEINFSEEPFKTIKQEDPNNHIGMCKITEVYMNLGKTKEAMLQLKKIVSAIVGLNIDYMATINLGGFKEIVDIVGGVDFYVPQRMYYTDEAQDLYIDLHKGQQLLDGEHAMQLVRFRKYVMGDIQRTKVQQEFIAELYKKILLTRDFNRIIDLATSAYNIFDADFGLAFALDYAEYFFDLHGEDLLNPENMVTLPSYGEKIDEIWYQYWDLDEVHEVVKTLIEKE